MYSNINSKHVFFCMCACVLSHSVVSNSLRPFGLRPIRLPCPWDFPGKNTGVSCSSFSRGFSRPRDWACVFCIGRQILYQWATGKPIHFTWKRATQDILISTWYSNGFKTHFAYLIRIIYEWLVAIILLIVDSNNKSARANSYLRHEGRFFCNSVKMSAYCSCVCRM